MDLELQKELQRLWSTLPDPIQHAILEVTYKTAVRNALASYSVSDNEREAFEVEVLLVLLGLQSREDLARNPEISVTSLTAGDLQHISEHLNTHFFAPLAPYLEESTVSQPIPLPKKSSDELLPAAEITLPKPPTPQTASAVERGGTASPLEQFIRKDPAITERFSKLPESVRAAIVSPEVATAFSSCVRTYEISEGSFKMLGMEIVRLLVGMQSTNDFRAHVRELTIVSAAQQDSLVSTTEKDIVRPVQEAIMAVLASRKSE